MSRSFLRRYENGCMNFVVDFLYRKHETENISGRVRYYGDDIAAVVAEAMVRTQMPRAEMNMKASKSCQRGETSFICRISAPVSLAIVSAKGRCPSEIMTIA